MARVRLPRSIDVQAGADQTAALQDFFDWVPDHSQVRLPPEGVVRVDGTLLIQDRVGFGLYTPPDTPAFEFRAVTDGSEHGAGVPTLHRKMFKYQGGSDHSIYNVITRGANPNAGTSNAGYDITRESQHCLEIRGVDGFLVDKWQAYAPYGDFLYLGYDSRNPASLARNITCRRPRLIGNGRQGVSSTGSEDVWIYDGLMEQLRRACLDIEPNDAQGAVRRFHFEHMIVGPTRLAHFSCVGNPESPMEDVYLRWNVLYGVTSNPAGIRTRMNITMFGDDLGGPNIRKRFTIAYYDVASGNQLGNPNGAAILAFYYDDLLVRNNHQPMQAGRNMHMVSIGACHGVRVIDNETLNASGSIQQDALGGNTDYCAEGNRIGNPYFLEPSTC